MLSYHQLVENAKAIVGEVSARDVQDRLARGESIVVIDVREQNEWNLGHAAPAMYIGRGVLEGQIESRVPRDATVVLVCASGNRSLLAGKSLVEMGYANVTSMAGGFRDWVASGGEIAD